MSGEERQRIVRRAGHNDSADAEQEEHARASREQASAEEARRQAEDDGPSRPRR